MQRLDEQERQGFVETEGTAIGEGRRPDELCPQQAEQRHLQGRGLVPRGLGREIQPRVHQSHFVRGRLTCLSALSIAAVPPPSKDASPNMAC